MADTLTLTRAACKAALEAALPAEFTVKDGRLHDSLGTSDAGGAVAGTSPIGITPTAGNQLVGEARVLVQVFGLWEKEVDNEKVIDPAPVEALARAFAREIQARQTGALPELWYIELERVGFPNDPTGQKTRFDAIVMGRAENPGVVETSA